MKNILIFFLMLIFSSSSLFAKPDLDSMNKELLNSKGEDKINLLIKISNAYLNQDKYDEAKIFVNRAFTNLKNMNNPILYADACLIMAKIEFTLYNIKSAKAYTLESINTLSNLDSFDKLSDAYILFSTLNYEEKNYEKSIQTLDKLIEILKENKQTLLLTDAYFQKGKRLQTIREYEKAIKIYEDILNSNSVKTEITKQAEIYHKLALAYFKVNLYEKALDASFKELSLEEKIGNIADISNTYNTIGMIFFVWKRYEKSIEYYKIGLGIVSEKKDTLTMARFNSNIGAVLYEQKNYQNALNYFNTALNLTENVFGKDTSRMTFRNKKRYFSAKALLLNNIGLIYQDLGNYNQALRYCQLSLDLKQKFSKKSKLAFPLSSIASIYLKLKNYSKAEEYALESLELSKAADDKVLINEAYNLLYQISFASQDYKKALRYKDKHTEVKDSLLDMETSKMMVEMEVKYETEKREMELKQEEEKNKLLEAKTSQQQVTIIIIIVFSILLFILIYSRYLQKKKANKHLSLLNDKISKQHSEMQELISQLQDREEELKDANATKDKFFSIIAHDLKNPLQALLLSADMLVKFRNKFSEDQLETKLLYIRKTARNISDLLNSLLQWARTQTGKIEFNPENVDLNVLIMENINLLSPNAFKKNIEIKTELPEDFLLYSDQNMITTVLRNLLSNAIKFTDSGGYVKIEGKDLGSKIEIMVEDNGIGIQDSDLSKLFRIDIHHTMIGTSQEKGTGLGLILCKEFIERHNGNLKVESTYGEGSKFIFEIPKINNYLNN